MQENLLKSPYPDVPGYVWFPYKSFRIGVKDPAWQLRKLSNIDCVMESHREGAATTVFFGIGEDAEKINLTETIKQVTQRILFAVAYELSFAASIENQNQPQNNLPLNDK